MDQSADNPFPQERAICPSCYADMGPADDHWRWADRDHQLCSRCAEWPPEPADG